MTAFAGFSVLSGSAEALAPVPDLRATVFVSSLKEIQYHLAANAATPRLVRRMGFVSEQFKVTPAQIAKMDKKQASDFLLDIIGTLDKGRIDLPRW